MQVLTDGSRCASIGKWSSASASELFRSGPAASPPRLLTDFRRCVILRHALLHGLLPRRARHMDVVDGPFELYGLLALNQQVFFMCSLPHDIILKIGSYLQVTDLCALSSCSRFWRELCNSDILWRPLFKERWPLLATFDAEDTRFPEAQTNENSQGWRRVYVMQHMEMASRASEVITFVTQSPATLSLEAGEYLHAVETMSSMRLGIQDVELFLFKPNLSVLLNLIGLIYCLQHLKPLPEHVLGALRRCGISEQLVWVKWLTLGRWSRGRRMRDEIVSRQVSLGDVVTGKEETVLRVLQRGVVHEVLRVCISTVDLVCTPSTSSTIRNY